MTIDEKLKLAINASLKAALQIKKIYDSDNFYVEYKKDNSPLTKADLVSNKIIKTELQKSKLPILSEEEKKIDFDSRKNWNELWIVDPIDGTKEFIKRNGEFTVNVALVRNKTPIIGVIYAPILKTLYFSSVEIGSYKFENINLNNFNIIKILNSAIKLPIIRVNKIYTIIISRSHISKQTELYMQRIKNLKGEIKTIHSGSSLKMCLVAEGKADAYPRFAPTMEWDTAAGQAICEQAGFKVINWKTKKSIQYNRRNLRNDWFIVN